MPKTTSVWLNDEQIATMERLGVTVAEVFKLGLAAAAAGVRMVKTESPSVTDIAEAMREHDLLQEVADGVTSIDQAREQLHREPWGLPETAKPTPKRTQQRQNIPTIENIDTEQREACKHPKARVIKGLCNACGKAVGK